MNVLLAVPSGALSDTVAMIVRQLTPQATVTYWSDSSQPITEAQVMQPLGLLVLSTSLYAEPFDSIVAACVANWRKTPLVALGDENNPQLIDAAFSAGAAGYLPASYSAPMMAQVLRLVLEGATYHPEARAQVQPAPGTAPGTAAADADSFGLTARQRDVLGLVAQGKTNHAVATQLGISEGTVKLHMNAIFKALNVANRSEAILVAARLPELRQMQIRHAESGSLDLEWLLPHMTHRRLAKGSWIFRLGDPGKELYYLQRGEVRLPEIDSALGPGDLFGEIGIFSPAHQRTCSARCETDVDLFSLTADQVKQIYYLNPHFAFYVVNLIAKRLMADRERAL